MKNFGNFFGKNVKFWQFFDSQMAIFRRVRFTPAQSKLRNTLHSAFVKKGLKAFQFLMKHSCSYRSTEQQIKIDCGQIL